MSKLAVVATLALGLAGSAQSRGTILFWTDSPIPSLRAMRPDGTHVRRIAAQQNAKRPSLSPDGKWVAFDGTPLGKPPLSDFDIEVVRLDGTQRRTVFATTDWELDAKWSPDGTRLSFSRMPPGADWHHSVVCTVRLDGTGLQQLGPGMDARWSPDGKRLVVAARVRSAKAISSSSTPTGVGASSCSRTGTSRLLPPGRRTEARSSSRSVVAPAGETTCMPTSTS